MSKCKHTYFRLENGQLHCAGCGKTPEEIRGEKPIEDKIAPQGETKIWPPESKRETKVIKKNERRSDRKQSKKNKPGKSKKAKSHR